MPLCTYACARRIASLMLILAITLAWSTDAFARKRRHGYRHHGVGHIQKQHKQKVPLPPSRPRHQAAGPPIPAFDPTQGKTDICLAMNAYFETSKVTTKEAMFMVAFVNKHRADEARADENMRLPFVGSLKGIVNTVEALRDHAVCLATYRAWAFSWTMRRVCRWCQKWIRLQSVPNEDDPKWLMAQEVARLVSSGWGPQHIGLDPELSRATYYFNPDETRRATACKYFYGPLVRLVHGQRIDRHEFYAVPTPEEQKQLAAAHNMPPDKIQIGVTKKGLPIWKYVSHSCDPVDALSTTLLRKAFNP